MRDAGETLIRRVCDEIGPGARPREDFQGRHGEPCWGIEVEPSVSFLRVAEIAGRYGLGRASVGRADRCHVLYWPALAEELAVATDARSEGDRLAA